MIYIKKLDISKLTRSSKKLESIIDNAFSELSLQSKSQDVLDTKTLKDLTATLKEAIAIKQNIYLLPTIAEQKMLELDKVKLSDSPDSKNEILITLEDSTDKYCV